MPTVAVVVIVIVAVLIIGAVGYVSVRREQRARLRERFGPEYDRTVERRESTREAEKELRTREEHHDKLQIRPLTPQARDRHRDEWRQVQEHFVDTPELAVTEAGRLVVAVMSERGYPTESHDQQVADLSVEHAATVDRYRAAHDISTRAETRQASTEELRQAMVHYRALFAELLGHGDTGARDTPVADRPAERPEAATGPEEDTGRSGTAGGSGR